MALNFNVDPYYDDFDPNKNFHRILFKPGFAVQARELTQSQTILQDQISKFASHVFQKNTPISGAKLTYNTNCYYIKLLPTYNNNPVDVALFDGALIQNQAGDVIARVLAVAAQSGGDPDTLVVTYLSGLQFQNSDVIYNVDNTNINAQLEPSNATGYSSVASISEGVFYVVNGFSLSQSTGSKYSIGHFVNVLPQTTILSKYTRTPNVRVGLNIFETIYDYVNDPSLLDQADGTSNFQGPGADRFVIKLELETRPIRLGDDQSFIELMRIENGQVKKQVDSTVYATIDEYFAKRTYEESGDYVVNNFKITPSANTSNTAQYNLGVGKGVAYVHGYRLENQSELVLTSDRSRDKGSKINDSTYINYGNFLYTTSANGFVDFVTLPELDLHVVGSGSISTTNAATYTSTVAATARVRGVEIHQQSGAKSTYVYKTHVTDVNLKSLSTTAKASSNTTAIYFNDTGGNFSTVNDAYKDVKVSVTTNGVTEFRRITSYKGATKYGDLDSALSITPTTNSTVSLNFELGQVESVVQMNKTTAPYKFKANSEISVLSKDSGLAAGNTQIQEAVSPELVYSIGYPYISGLANTSYTTSYIFRSINFGASSASLDLNTGDPFTILSTTPSDYLIINNATGAIGSIANLTSITLSGDEKTATLNIVPGSDLASMSATVITRVAVNNADNTQYVLKHKNLVQGDTADVHITGTTVATNTKVDLTYGHVYILNAGLVSPGNNQSLYISDVKRIVKIIDTKASGTAATSDMLSDSSYDVTNNYYFDNGQRDSYYGHASIKLKPGRPQPAGNLLVIVDYYEYDTSSGDGYFSVRSYLSVTDGGVSSEPELYQEIPSYTSKNGTTYQLRDCVDFRPSVQNAQANFTLSTHNNAFFIPVNKDVFESNYDYYLARKDILVLSKDRNFEIIRGTPAINPALPSKPDGALVIANLTLDPYTAYVPGEGPRGTSPNLSIEKVQNRRWTMKDITDLQVRVNNIEYYTALNILEKDAQNLQIPDVNGLNRFKNGILVDDFSSYATVDTNNLDFSASINRRNKVMSAPQVVENYPLQSLYLLNSSNNLDETNLNFTVKTIGPTSLFMLPYTTANLVTQTIASNTINVNPFNYPIIEGEMSLNPPMDNWVDRTKQPDLLLVDPDLQIFQAGNTLNLLSVGDWKAIPGTSYDRSTTTTDVSTTQSGRTVTETTTSTTITRTYADLSQDSTLGYYDKIPSYVQENGFITDVSILPYIRPQSVLFRAKGLLINTPVKVWFDGVSVDKYITAPDAIELNNVYGNFQEGDVIGYTTSNEFFPFGIVAGVYKYENTSNVRLYITGNIESNFLGVSKIENARFNINGTKTGNTAFGTAKSANVVIDVHNTGYVTSVGNNYTDITGTSFSPVRSSTRRVGNFVRRFGIWRNALGTGASFPSSNVPLNFRFNVPTTGTYYIKLGARFDGGRVASYDVYNASNSAISFTNDGSYTRTASIALTKGTSNVAFRMTYNTAATQNRDHVFALAISDKAWASGDEGSTTTGNVIFSTVNLASNTSIQNVTRTTNQFGGGQLHTGVTQFSLCPLAKQTDNYYSGCKISVTAVEVTGSTGLSFSVNSNSVKSTTKTATILSYVGANNTVFVDTPVSVSTGDNPYAGGDISSQYTISGTANSYLVSTQNDTPPKLSTDETGSVLGIFNIPPDTFRTGDRIFRVDNRLVDTDPESASTIAQSVFVASGLSAKSQALNFSPSISGAKNTFTRTAVRTNQLINTTSSTSTSVQTWQIRGDPVCQTFIIEKENFPNGAFLNSVKLFFASKPTSVQSPIRLSIIGTENGYPNGETLDNSIVTVQSADVKVSAAPHVLDETTYTEFVFPAPVYIQSNVLYAILLESPSNEYNVYLGAQNAIAIPSTVKNLPTDPTPSVITKIGTAPYIGSLFESQNGLTWTAEQGKALMFTIERCVFDTSAAPQIPLSVPAGLPNRKLTGQEINLYYDANNLSGIFGTVTGNNVPSHAYNITATDFVPTATKIDYTYKSVLSSDFSVTSDTSVNPGKFGCPTDGDIYLNDGKGERVLISSSNSSFVLTTKLTSSDNSVSPVVADDGTSLYNITYLINNMELSNDSITLISGGTGYNANAVYVTVSAPDDPSGTQAAVSANVQGGIVKELYVTDGGSGYWTTPTITVLDNATRSGNSNTSFIVNGETNSSGGNALARYVTKKVVLTPQNDSSDLRVYYTAYRPLGTNILVYYKVLNRNDTQTFEDSEWVLMTTLSNSTTYSRSRADIYEYVAAPGADNVADDYITYTSTNGQTYTSFSQFAIKIVLTTNDKTNVPFLKDIRAIALPSGTGI